MSETYRNTTFLIAIRDAGFVCRELLGVYGGVNDSTTWTATCSQMLAYTVSVANSGVLANRADAAARGRHCSAGGAAVRARRRARAVLPPQELRPQPR